MGQRLDLQALLEAIIGPAGKVYFQPPDGSRMVFPCIVYNLDNVQIDHASNLPYRHTNRYSVTVIDRDPDSEFPRKIQMIPSVAFNRFYTADLLNHWVHNIYF